MTVEYGGGSSVLWDIFSSKSPGKLLVGMAALTLSDTVIF